MLLFCCQESEGKGNDKFSLWFPRKGKKGQENEWILKLRKKKIFFFFYRKGWVEFGNSVFGLNGD